jgi:hypothetical protein
VRGNAGRGQGAISLKKPGGVKTGTPIVIVVVLVVVIGSR